MRISRSRCYNGLVIGLMCLAVGCGGGDRANQDFASAPPDQMETPEDGTGAEAIEPEPWDVQPPASAPANLEPVTMFPPEVEETAQPSFDPGLAAAPGTQGGSTLGVNSASGSSFHAQGQSSNFTIKGGVVPKLDNWQPPGVKYVAPGEPETVDVNSLEAFAETAVEQPPVATSTGADITQVDEIISKLRSGNIAYNAPESMHYRETRIIELLLSPQESPELLRAQVSDQRDVRSEQVQQVAKRMEAELRGEGFNIELLDPEIQFISSLKPTRWRWKVSPTTSGTQDLHLSLNAHIDMDGGGVYVIRSVDSVIQVEISLAEQVTDYVSANWQWLWATFIVPVVGYRMRGRRKRRRDDWDDNYGDTERIAA